jgi:hypothetical protein
MSGTGLRFAIALFVVVGVGLASQAAAQGTKSARGTVTAMSGDSITVKAADRELKLMVDPKTVLEASGAGTAERKAEAAGKPGTTRLADFVKVGDAVEVNYHETGSTMHASNIKRVTDAGSKGGSMSAEHSESANGTVDSLSGSTLAISGKTASATFKQSFHVDGTTKVIAVGGSTAADAKGGKVAIADFVGVGDQVTVNYHKAGSSLHADEVRVRVKAPKK